MHFLSQLHGGEITIATRCLSADSLVDTNISPMAVFVYAKPYIMQLFAFGRVEVIIFYCKNITQWHLDIETPITFFPLT